MNKDSKEELKEKAKRERVKAFKSNSNTQWVASHLKTVYTVVNLLMIVTLVLTISFKWDLLIPVALLGAVVFILSLIFKDLTSEKMRDKVPFHFKTGLLLLVSNLVAYAIGTGLKGTIPNNILTAITFVASFVTAIVMLNLFRQKKFIERIETMMEKNFFDEMLGEEIKDGDAILGINLEDGKPVVLPYSDRFLHMLALGATGTGKTAMTLTPMAWRDINNPNMGFTVIEPKGN